MDTTDIVETDSVSPLQVIVTATGLVLGAIAVYSWGGKLRQKLAERKVQDTILTETD